MTLPEKQRDLLDALARLGTGHERLAWLVVRARNQSLFPDQFRTATHKVEGCLSDLWLVTEWRDRKCFFRCDSNSQIVKGIASLLCEFYSGHSPSEILAVDASFLERVGINQHLTPNRRNALARVWETIRAFAETHATPSDPAAPATDSSVPPPQTPLRLRYYDAHNHLQDERLGGDPAAIVAAAAGVGVVRMVVNGSCESDWPAVQALARQHPLVVPSFGIHPWYVHERTPNWLNTLTRFLYETPGAVIGEIGLDRWKPDLAYSGQEDVFKAQLQLAAERNLPVSIHCLKAWGRLHDLLRDGPRPARGFLLHSYGGPAEMVTPLARLGAYFSFPGYFIHERKTRQREAFRAVPSDRLLVETDAPDQLPPTDRVLVPLADPATGQPVNHPANLPAVYAFLADFLGEPVESLAARVERIFQRLFATDQAAN